MSSAVLEGFVVIVQDDVDTARRLELALGQAGATVFKTVNAGESLELLWKLRPLAVVMNPAPDLAGSVFLWALARDASCKVIQYVADGEGHGGSVRVERTRPASEVVEAVVALTRELTHPR